MWKKLRILSLLTFFSVCLFAQTKHATISVDYENISVADLIDSVRKIAGLRVAYDVRIIPVDSVVTVKTESESPVGILSSVLKNNNVEILNEHGQVIIRKKEEQEYFKIHGKVSDESGNPLPWVNISLKNVPLGTITNRTGEYEILIPGKYSGDSLFYSSLGYKTTGVPVRIEDTVININLQHTSIKLPEVVIKYKKADDIIKKFIENRDENYFEKKVLFTAFFRETIKQDNKYVNVSEAVLNILKYPYDTPEKMEYVKFVKGRKYNNVNQMKYVNLRLEGGPYYFSRIDVARYLDFFPDKNGFSAYRYKLKGLDYEYNRLVYVVEFEPDINTQEIMYSGVLRFDSKSFALVSASFELSKNSLRKSRKYIVRKESGHIKAFPFYAGYSVSYRPFNDKWVLKKVIGELKIRIADKKSKKTSVFSALSEMLFSDFSDAGKIRFKTSELYRFNYILSEQINSYDSDFWESYNVIKPDEDLENVFKKGASE
ncbi:MAG: carboxypeptidase regulatory-like domain-containing protein [Chlorobi bacterium]|nr:carboxypeptidase regulatory-like domain-containing protein [Chlorobiota bacterium]